MATIAQAAVAASVLVGLVSIPAASHQVTSPEAVSDNLPNISTSKEVPKEVTQSTSSDSFDAEIKTAFNRFTTEIEHDSVESSVENPNSGLEVEKTPSETRWELTTSSGVLTVVKSSDSVVERSTTPYGTLEIRQENGAHEVSFEGSNREEAEKLHRELRKVMESRKEDLDEKRDQLEEEARPDVEVVANSSTASGYGDNEDEHVVLVNNDLEAVSLEGWKLTDEADSYTFPSVTLEAGERVKVYSNHEWRGNEGTDIAWNNDGDTATVFNEAGERIDSETY